MSNKSNWTADNSNYTADDKGQGVDDARHKRDLRNDAVKNESHGKPSDSDENGSGDKPPGARPPETGKPDGSGNKPGDSGSASGSGKGPAGTDGGSGSSGGNGFSQMADRLEKAGNAAKGGAQAAGEGVKAAAGAVGDAARAAGSAAKTGKALCAAAEDPTGAVKAAGAAVGRAILKKIMIMVTPLLLKIMLLLLCLMLVIMPFVLIFGLTESEPSPEEVAAAEVARERGDQFDIVDWGDNEQTFDWLLAELSKSRKELIDVTGERAREYASAAFSAYADKWGAEAEDNYLYRLRYNQSEIEMQMDVASLICAMYSVSQSSGSDSDGYGAGDGDGFLESVDDEDSISSVDVKGDYHRLLRQARKLAIKTYKVELVYPTGGRVLIYPANINIDIGWQGGLIIVGDWTKDIQWDAQDAFYADGSFVEPKEVPVVVDGETTDETEEKTALKDNCFITVDIDLRDEFFNELVEYFDLEIPDGMDPATEYRAKRDIFTSAGGWEGYMEDEIDEERGFDPDVQPTSFETALDASFHFLHTKGVTLTNNGGGIGPGGEMLSYGDVKYYIEEHANATSSTLVFPGMLPAPVPSYWLEERHLFREFRGNYEHQGTDTPARGETVTAGAPGEIVKVVNTFSPGQFSNSGSAARGNLIIVYYGERDDGIKVYMVFQHVDYVLVSTGEGVNAGNGLGIVGNTGECYGQSGGHHLHTETHYVYNSGGLWTGAKAQDSDQHFNR